MRPLNLALPVILTAVLCANFGCSLKPLSNEAAPNTTSYVSYHLPFTEYNLLFQKLEQKLKLHLKSRGEAHVTVITPPEFKVLASTLSAERIHALASEFLNTKVDVKKICLGHFKNQISETFFVVVESKSLVAFRQKLAFEAGLSEKLFNPFLFYPHVTIGFTDRDLHYEDGAIKDQTACSSQLQSIYSGMK